MSDNAKTYHWNVSEDTEMKQDMKQDCKQFGNDLHLCHKNGKLTELTAAKKAAERGYDAL